MDLIHLFHLRKCLIGYLRFWPREVCARLRQGLENMSRTRLPTQSSTEIVTQPVEHKPPSVFSHCPCKLVFEHLAENNIYFIKGRINYRVC